MPIKQSNDGLAANDTKFQWPIREDAGARTWFMATAVGSIAILLWNRSLETPEATGLTPIFHFLFTLYDHTAILCALTILLVSVFIPGRLRVDALLSWLGKHVCLVALAVALLLAIGTLTIYRNHPLSMDEYASVFQSQVFASGSLTGQFPPLLLDWLIPDGFQQYFLRFSRSTGQVTSAYWPSFALLLTPFMWLGIPWACNPAISACTVLAIHRLTLIISRRVETAGLAVLLTLASPVFFADGISYYAMAAHLLANSVFCILLLRATAMRAFLAGIVGSIALTLHNPMPHALFALPWLIWLVSGKDRRRHVLPLVAGYVPLCVLLGIGWYVFSNGLAHGARVDDAGGQLAALLASAFNAPSADVAYARIAGLAKLWVWAAPGVLVLAAIGALKLRREAPVALLTWSAAATFVGFLLVPFDQGHGWGFRYFHSVWMVVPIFAALALNDAKRPLAVLVVACSIISVLVGNGLRAVQIRGFMDHHLAGRPADTSNGPRLQLIQVGSSFYGADLVQNDPYLRTFPIRMMSRGRLADEEMIRSNFPGYRRIYSDAHGDVWSPGEAVSPSGQLR